MKNSIKNNLSLKKYRLIGIVVITISVIYLISDFIEWYIYKDRLLLDYQFFPLYRRLLSYIYIVILGIGGLNLVKQKNYSWDLIFISTSSIIPSFLITSFIWGIPLITNWTESFLLLLWWYSLGMILFCIIKRKDFKINNWGVKVILYVLINIILRYLHELFLFHISNT